MPTPPSRRCHIFGNWTLIGLGRQLGITLRDGTIYLSNRFQIQAIDAATGLPVWQSQEVPGRAGMSQEWSLVPMPPTIFRDHVVARFLRSTGLMLACFDRRTGSLVWSTTAPSEIEFISDPWWANDKLFGLATRKTDLSQLELQLAQLDPATGSIRRLFRLVSMQDHWKLRRVCQVAVLEENAIVTLGGIVCCFDFEGQIRWLRRTRVTPPRG